MLRRNNKPAQLFRALADCHVGVGGQKDGEASPKTVVKDEPEEDAVEGKLAAKPPPSVEALEAAMLAGLMQKKGFNKKLATNDQIEGPPVAVMNKPSAAVVLKRPAARHTVPGGSNIDMSSIFAKIRARKGTMWKKGFTSMAYNNEKTMAENSGFSAEQATEIAGEAFGKASALYDTD